MDIYLYDSLSSGAGYSSLLGNDGAPQSILSRSRDILQDCDCDSACVECLMHYQNKAVHRLLDRHCALELLDYAQDGVVRSAIRERPEALFAPLKEALLLEFDAQVEIVEDGLHIDVNHHELIVRGIPDMVNKKSWADGLVFWESQLEKGLPFVFDGVIKGLWDM